MENTSVKHTKADEISRLVPEATVSYAHGQMTGPQIEDIMKPCGKKWDAQFGTC